MVRSPRELRAGDHRSAARRREPRSATTRSTSRSGSRTTATSRSRSSSTGSATASTSASATAPSSAATRRSSRRRPTPALDPRTRARRSPRRAIRAVVAAGYENVGTLEFLVDGDGQLLLHRDQLPHPGGAPGDRDAHRHRPRRRADPHRGRRAARATARRTSRCAATPSSSASTPRTPRTTSGRRPGVVERYLAPGGPGVRMDSPPLPGLRGAAVLRLAAGQAHRVGPRPRRRPSPAPAPRSTSCVVDGLVTNVAVPPRAARQRDVPGGPRSPRTCSTASAAPRSSPRPAPSRPTTATDRRDRRRRRRPPRRRVAAHTTREIEALIPHRWPFLLVDRIVEYDPEAQRIVGIRASPRPSGSSRATSRACRSCPACSRSRRSPRRWPSTSRSRRASATGSACSPASTSAASSASSQPGDRLPLEVTMEKLGRRFGRGRAVASVDGEVACEATLSLHHPARRSAPLMATAHRRARRHPRQRRRARGRAQGRSRSAQARRAR